MNNYLWNRKNVDLDPDEIAPWKLPRDRHATISVLKHRLNELHTVDDYLSNCERQFEVDYIILMNGTTEQAWRTAMAKLNAQFNLRRHNVVLECLQFGGNKEFWDGFPNEYEIEGYFKKCYAFAVDKIGYLRSCENIICAVVITEPNRRNLFVYYLPVTPKWQVKVMSGNRNDSGTQLQEYDENGKPKYMVRADTENPRLSRSEFWKCRGGLTSFSDLQEDFFKKVSEQYGAVRGKSTSQFKNAGAAQIERFGRYQDDHYDVPPYFDDSPYHH